MRSWLSARPAAAADASSVAVALVRSGAHQKTNTIVRTAVAEVLVVAESRARTMACGTAGTLKQ